MPNIPKKIIIHHSATKDGTLSDYEAIKRYHMETNKWDNIAYHWIVEMVNGKPVVRTGRKENEIGAHTVGMNSISIGICVVGNYDVDKLPNPLFDVLVNLIKDINARYKTKFPIEPHSKYAPKTCPGKLFPLSDVIKAVGK